MNERPIRWENEEVVLREISADDAGLIVRWRSDPDVYRFFKNPRKITLEEHLAWFDRCYLPDADRFDFIVLTPNGDPVGTVSAVWEPEAHCVEVSYLICPEHRRKGWARKALRAVCGFSLGRWPVREFVAVVHRQNHASMSFIQGQGFAREKEAGPFFIYRKVVGR